MIYLSKHFNNRQVFTATAITLFAMLFSHSSYAEIDKDLSQILDCTQLTENEKRLDCFDKTSREIKQKLPTKRNEFLGKKYLSQDKHSSPNQIISLTLISASKTKKGFWTFEFENGQVWQQLEQRYLSKPKSLPATAKISNGIFGSYDLRIENSKRMIKVKRLK